MRVAVISDIHANLPALEAVLEHIDTQDVQEVWCLGDLLGYGPSPNEVISYASDWNIVLSGNHDRGVAGALRLSSMRLHTPKAIELMQWTAAQLTPSSSKMLQHIVSTPGILSPVENISLAHGSPLEGEASVIDYIAGRRDAEEALTATDARLVLVGHSHFQLYFGCDARGNCISADIIDNAPQRVRCLERGVANPGSVGKPRDDDPRAAYLILDTETMTLDYHRVAYDIQRAAAAITASTIPEPYRGVLARELWRNAAPGLSG